MPRISEFFGITIYMYWFDNQKHQLPHFHARHQGDEAVFDLHGKLIGGNIGRRAQKLIREWVSENQVLLRKSWKLALEGKDLPWINPLQ